MAVPLQAGDKAPEFRLPRDGGSELSLASFAGKKLVLYFYPKDDTSGCTRQAIDFSALRPAFAAVNTEVIGVSPDPPESHDAFKSKHNIDLALGSDETKSVCESYGVWTQKSMYGRKYMGVERTTFLIDPSGRIATIWTKVSVPAHAELVLAAATSL